MANIVTRFQGHFKSPKPDRWGLEPGLVAPEWEWAWRNAAGSWPMWEGGASRTVRDLSQHRNDGIATIVGTGGFKNHVNGPQFEFTNDNDFIDLGVETPGGVGLFAGGTQPWTVIFRAFWQQDDNGTLIARCDATSSLRTFQVQNGSGSSTVSPGINIRGINTNTSWQLDLSVHHTLMVRYDGASTCEGSYEGLAGWLNLPIGTAVEETGQRIICGARSNGAGFLSSLSRMDYVHILPFAITTDQKLQLADDPYGLYRPRKRGPIKAPVLVPAFLAARPPALRQPLIRH